MKAPFTLLTVFFLLSFTIATHTLLAQQLVNSDHLKLPDLRAQLYSVPEGGKTIIELPNHMDIWRDYIATESNILAPDFRQRRSDVRTFRIVDKKNPLIRGRLAVSQHGMHAIIISTFGTIYIENAGTPDSDQYFIYLNDNPIAEIDEELPRPSCMGSEIAPEYREPMRRFNMRNNDVLEFGDVIRTYNLAIVATGDFYLNNGGTILLVEDAIINSVNAIQAIFEMDLGVTFNLLDPHIYTNPATDPFNAPPPSLTKQAADAVHANFSLSEYDIGHVFHNSTGSSIGGGGVAGLGVVCREFLWQGGPGRAKGAGWSGSFSNTTNNWIQLAAHEIGHMFNAAHTFNGSGGSCSGGNFSPNTNYEIGSGSTIMSYQGICGSGQNIPSAGAADNYFHANSLERMVDYILDLGDCHATDDLGNSPPVAEADPCGLINRIPFSTPFKIIGDATDPDGDILSFAWEQYDNDGPSGPTQGKIGAEAASDPLAPLFRSFPPTNTATRYFPSKSLILDGNFASSFEPLPTVARDLTFRLSVRDGNGGLGMDEISIEVENAGPFEITFPNGGEDFDAGDNITVTWDVNGTDLFCNDVNIYLSVDGGQTFPYQLAEEESNNGSLLVELPESLPNTSNARIKVACADNPCVVFFTISADNFEIESECEAPNTTISPDSFAVFDLGDPDLDLDLQNNLGSVVTGFDGTIDTDDEEGLLVFLDGTPFECAVAGNPTHYHFYSFAVDVSGSYTIAHGGPFGTVLNLYSSPFTGSNCTNHIASSAQRPSGSGPIDLFSNLTANLETGTLYVVMVSSFSSGFPGYPFDYNIQFTSTPPSANVYDGVILPTDYSYTYIAVNSSTGIITLEDDDSDFTGLPSGSYDIYGVAWYSGSGPVPPPVDPNDWTGQPLFTVLGTDCAVISANSMPIVVLSSGDCDASFEFSGVSSLENPPFNTVEFCQSDPNPSPVITGNPGGEFSANNPNISINPNTGQINLSSSQPGTYIVTYEDDTEDGCDESIEIIIHPNPSASASNTGPYCVGETIQLSASGGTSYSWSGPNGFSSSVQNPSIANATLVMAGTYSVTVTDANGCSDVATTIVVVNPNPTASASNTGPYCEGETIQLSASGGTSYSWSGPAGFSSSDQNPSIANATLAMAGTYSVTVTDANGCSNVATTNVAVNPNPTASASNTGPYCKGETIQLSASGGTSYSWSGPDGFSSSVQNPSIANATLALAGTYSVTVTDANGCSDVATTNVAVNPNPTASASNTGPYCEGETIQLSASGGTSYSWSGPDGFSSSVQNPSITNATTAMGGTYSVTVTDANGCSDVATTNVVVNSSPPASASNTGPYCESETIELSASGGASYSWSGPDGFSSSVQNPSIANATTAMGGTYSVTVTDANGCSDVVSTNVEVNENPESPDLSVDCSAGAGNGIITVNSPLGGNLEYSLDGGPFQSSPEFTNLANGTYEVVVRNINTGCESGATPINVNCGCPDEPTLNLSSLSGEVCGLTSITVENNTFGGSATEVTLSHDGSGTLNPLSVGNSPFDFSYTPAAGDIGKMVTITVVTNNPLGAPCVPATANFELTVHEPPTASADNTGPYCPGEDILLLGSGGVSYNWSGPDGFNSALQNPTISNASEVNSGTYMLTATDVNGCTASASTVVVVEDDEAPLIDCPGDITISIPGGQSEGFVNLSPATATDNCDLDEITNDYNSGGADASDLYPVGNTEVIFTATDLAGNSSTCSTEVTVIEGPSNVTVSGVFKRGNDEPLPGVIVNYSGDESGTQSTDSDGFFSFVVSSGVTIELDPDRPTSWVEFVSTIDLINIQRHILNLELLGDPYKIISADINADNIVSTFDLVLLQQLIVGIQDSIAGNTSWRFIPASYVFDDPENPLAEDFPELIEYENITADTSDNWVALKTGDVTWPSSGSRMALDAPVYFITEQLKSDGNQHQTRLLSPDERVTTTGYQFELHFNPGELSINHIDIDDSDLPGISKDHFFVDNDKGILRALWYDGRGFEMEPGMVLFEIVWTSAKNSTDLLSAVAVSPIGSRLTAFIALENQAPAALRLTRNTEKAKDKVIISHGVLPNPWTHAAELRIELADDKQVEIELFDASGRLIHSFEMEGRKGINSIQMDSNLPSGKLFYNIRVDGEEYRGQMIRLE